MSFVKINGVYCEIDTYIDEQMEKIEKSSSRKNSLRKYGLTVDQFETLLRKQDGNCAVCGGPFTIDTDEPRVDHDHRTGKVRGLLHNHCNSVLGLAHDSISILEGAMRYLIQHQPQELPFAIYYDI